MNKRNIMIIIILTIALILIIFSFNKKDSSNSNEINKLEATVLYVADNYIKVQDTDNIIYTFNSEEIDLEVGNTIILEYSGLLDKNNVIQTNNITSYEVVELTEEDFINEESMFSTYNKMAYDKLNTLTLDEKIGQLFLVRYPNNNAIEDLKKYNFGGFVFFEKDFKNKRKEEVVSMINELQKNSNVPLLTAVDEEGGKVVRISSNPNLRSDKFKSPQELYSEGGFDLIEKDTKEKSELLKNLGINLNLAPVVDVATDSTSYMYPRTLGENTSLTSTYAKTVIEASKGTGVSYTLKHFPGYGNNIDTHIGSAIDTRTYDEIFSNDLPPFEAGIDVGAEVVLVSHNIVNGIDPDNQASLSPAIHNLLRNELAFTGIIITDDLAMSAVSNIDNLTLKALLAGNDLIITTDYETSINDVKKALNDGLISENLIDKLAFRNLAWKYYKGLMYDSK